MGTKFTYRRIVKPKNKESKLIRETGVRYYCYRDNDGVEHIKVVKYTKLVRKDVNNNQENQ